MLQYNVHDIRTTVRDVMMMYCKEWYMKNLPKGGDEEDKVGRGEGGERDE